MMRLTAPLQMLTALLKTLINYVILDLGKNSFYLPFPIMCVAQLIVDTVVSRICILQSNLFFFLFYFFTTRMPFDWRTLLGYPFAWLIESAAVFSTFFVVCPNITLTSCIGLLIISITKDVKSDLQLLNVPGRSIRSQIKAKTNFFRILKFYLGLKELSDKIIEQYSILLI